MGKDTKQSSNVQAEAKAVDPAALVPAPNETRQAMIEAYSKAGIPVPDELEAPEPDQLEPIDAKSLCDLPTQYPGAERESATMVLMKEPVVYPSKLKGAKSFVSAEVFHSGKKKAIILTHSYEREDGSFTPLGLHFKQLVAGKGVFKIAMFRTSNDFTVIRPIPVGATV